MEQSSYFWVNFESNEFLAIPRDESRRETLFMYLLDKGVLKEVSEHTSVTFSDLSRDEKIKVLNRYFPYEKFFSMVLELKWTLISHFRDTVTISNDSHTESFLTRKIGGIDYELRKAGIQNATKCKYQFEQKLITLNVEERHSEPEIIDLTGILTKDQQEIAKDFQDVDEYISSYVSRKNSTTDKAE